MPDWKTHIRRRLAALSIDPACEAEIIDELAQHRVRDVPPVASWLSEHRAHVPRGVIDGERVSGQRVDQPTLHPLGERLPGGRERSGLQIHAEREPDVGRQRELVLHGVEMQVLGLGQRLVWRPFLRVL